MAEFIESMIIVAVIGFLLYFTCFLIFRFIYWVKWLRMTPYERENEKKRRRRRNYNASSSSSDSWWSFDSGSSAGDCSGGDGGGGGGCD